MINMHRSLKKRFGTPDAEPRMRIICETIGPGKAALLGLIAETHSISEAARRMKMSYKRAWQLIEAMKNICEKEGFDMSLVMVTDILEEATYLLYAGSPRTLIGEAFKKDASGTHVYLPGVMSRKKQIIPPLSEAVKRIKN